MKRRFLDKIKFVSKYVLLALSMLIELFLLIGIIVYITEKLYIPFIIFLCVFAFFLYLTIRLYRDIKKSIKKMNQKIKIEKPNKNQTHSQNANSSIHTYRPTPKSEPQSDIPMLKMQSSSSMETNTYTSPEAEAEIILESAQKSAEIINTTLDPADFFFNLYWVIKQLEELSTYKRKLPYMSDPEYDIKRILKNKEKTIEVFIDRCYDSAILNLKDCKSIDDIRNIEFNFSTIDVHGRDKMSSENKRYYENKLKQLQELTESLIKEKQEQEKQGQLEADLFNNVIETGIISVSKVKEWLGYTTEDAHKYLDLWERHKSKFSDIEIKIDRENAKHYDNMDGHEFERFCAVILEKNGFKEVEVTSGSGDYGVDILAVKDLITYAIQCKCYSSNIGNKAIQEIYSGKDFYKRHVGVVLTNQYFTNSAKETAERTGIVLWDREQLEQMIEVSNTSSITVR